MDPNQLTSIAPSLEQMEKMDKQNKPEELKKSKGSGFIIILLSLSTILAVTIAVFFYFQNQALKKALSQVAIEPTVAPTVEPTYLPTTSPSSTPSASPKSKTTSYSCPANGWVNCMPILTPEAQKACSAEAVSWYQTNCPNFQGIAQ